MNNVSVDTSKVKIGLIASKIIKTLKNIFTSDVVKGPPYRSLFGKVHSGRYDIIRVSKCCGVTKSVILCTKLRTLRIILQGLYFIFSHIKTSP